MNWLLGGILLVLIVQLYGSYKSNQSLQSIIALLLASASPEAQKKAEETMKQLYR